MNKLGRCLVDRMEEVSGPTLEGIRWQVRWAWAQGISHQCHSICDFYHQLCSVQSNHVGVNLCRFLEQEYRNE